MGHLERERESREISEAMTHQGLLVSIVYSDSVCIIKVKFLRDHSEGMLVDSVQVSSRVVCICMYLSTNLCSKTQHWEQLVTTG